MSATTSFRTVECGQQWHDSKCSLSPPSASFSCAQQQQQFHRTKSEPVERSLDARLRVRVRQFRIVRRIVEHFAELELGRFADRKFAGKKAEEIAGSSVAPDAAGTERSVSARLFHSWVSRITRKASFPTNSFVRLDLFSVRLSDSGLSVTLRESGEIQKQLSKELLRYEQDVERLCLSPLQDILENDIPTLTKARKTLQKSMQEVETLKQKVNQAVKSAQQQNGPQTQIKVDTLRRELDEANQRMIQSRVSLLQTTSFCISCPGPIDYLIFFSLCSGWFCSRFARISQS